MPVAILKQTRRDRRLTRNQQQEVTLSALKGKPGSSCTSTKGPAPPPHHRGQGIRDSTAFRGQYRVAGISTTA